MKFLCSHLGLDLGVVGGSQPLSPTPLPLPPLKDGRQWDRTIPRGPLTRALARPPFLGALRSWRRSRRSSAITRRRQAPFARAFPAPFCQSAECNWAKKAPS